MLTQTELKRLKCDQTPLSNTGSNSQKLQNTSLGVRVDWLQGTIRFDSLAELHDIIEFIEGYIKEKFVLHPDRGRFVGKQWFNAAQGVAGGCLVLYNLPDQESDGRGHAFLSFPAAALSSMDARDVWRMASGLVGLGVKNPWRFKATRIDIALDDYSKSITFEQVNEAARKKNYTGFRKSPVVHHTYQKGKIAGFTIVYGTRASDRLLRFYDKEFESKGRIKSNRWELELHDELAQKALADWLAIEPENFEEYSPKLLAGMVVGTIDFVKRGYDKNVTRMPRLEWWATFKETVGMEIRHSKDPVLTSLEKKKRWITRQVIVTLAMLKKIMGIKGFKQYLAGELDQAQERFTSWHETFIQVYGRGNAEIDFSWDVCNE